jgi:hypothetical protein
MPERAPTPERLAELYDLLDPWDPGDDLHLGLVMAAGRAGRRPGRRDDDQPGVGPAAH